MAKKKTVFVCQHCGYESPKWMGKCPGCAEWNSMVEEKIIHDQKIEHSRQELALNLSRSRSLRLCLAMNLVFRLRWKK